VTIWVVNVSSEVNFDDNPVVSNVSGWPLQLVRAAAKIQIAMSLCSTVFAKYIPEQLEVG